MYPDTPDEIGLLVGGIVGTLPALTVLAFVLWWCSIIFERHSGTHRTPRSEARCVGIRPKIHEAMVCGNCVYYDGGHVLVWKKTQVSRFHLLVISLFFATDHVSPSPSLVLSVTMKKYCRMTLHLVSNP